MSHYKVTAHFINTNSIIWGVYVNELSVASIVPMIIDWAQERNMEIDQIVIMRIEEGE